MKKVLSAVVVAAALAFAGTAQAQFALDLKTVSYTHLTLPTILRV